MENKFKVAVERGEALDYFCGNGVYFYPDPDWGDHLHVRSWEDLCSYLRDKEDPLPILSDFFGKYVDGLPLSYAAADGMLMNIDSYYYFRRKNAFMQGGDLLSMIGNPRRDKIGRLFRLLRAEFSSENEGRQVVPLDKIISDIRDNGCPYDLESL